MSASTVVSEVSDVFFPTLLTSVSLPVKLPSLDWL